MVGSIAVTVLNFCLHSIFREYGVQFIRRIAAPHPVRTAKAFLQAGKMDVSGDMIRIPGPDRPGPAFTTIVVRLSGRVPGQEQSQRHGPDHG